MRKFIQVVAVVATAFPLAAAAQDAPRQIVVTGEGEVSASPDMAVIHTGVSKDAPRAGDAMAAAAEAMASVLSTVKAAGIEDRDIQTTRIGLDPRYQYSNDGRTPPRLVGYSASNAVMVRVRELDALGGLLDALASGGATEISGLSFAIAEPRPLEDQARTEAVADARAKAELLAGAAGVKLGQVLQISEAGAVPVAPQPMFREMAAADAAMPVAAGEIDLRASVTIVYGIAE